MASADILRAARAEHTAGPWEYVPGNEHHGPYVVSNFGSTICDCYVMTEPHPVWSDQKRKPVPFLAEMAEPNARLIAAAPDLLSIAKRWAAIDGGAWDAERYEREREGLLADTHAAIDAAEAEAGR